MKISKANIVVIIPSYNEAKNLTCEIRQLKKHNLNNVIVSIDPKTTDNTEKLLKSEKTKSVIASKSGYDSVMLSGVNAIKNLYPNTKAVLFTDAGNRNNYKYVNIFIEKSHKGASLVIGTRNNREKTMLWHQRLGTNMVLVPINTLFGKKIKDNGPFRLIDYRLLMQLDMVPRKFRWTTEMLVKTLSLGKKITQVPVEIKKRKGKSKISGSTRNSILAAFDMLTALGFARYKAK